MEQITIEEGLLLQEEEWGLRLVAGNGIEINNTNLLPRIEKIIKLAKEREKNRILIEASAATRNVSITKLFQAGELLLQLRTSGFKVAFVAPQFINTDESLFVENVGSNRGFYVRYFPDSGEALNWILS